MNRIAIIVLLLLLGLHRVNGADSTIMFRKVQYSDLLKKAKHERKPLMLFFHFDGCGACKRMEQEVFTVKEVYDYYNASFICYSINTLKGSGKEINKIYKVDMCPEFLFLDTNGYEIHKVVGFLNAEDFIAEGKKVFDSSTSLAAYRKAYAQHSDDKDFLRRYCYMLSNADELDTATIQSYLSMLTEEEMKKPENISFIYRFSYYEQKPIPAVNSTAYNFLIRNRPLFYKYFDSEQVNARIVFIAIDAIYKAIDNKDEQAFNKIIPILKQFDGKLYAYKTIEGDTKAATFLKYLSLKARISFYESTGDTMKYNTTISELINLIWNDDDELNSLAWEFYEKHDNKQDLANAITWAERAVYLHNSFANNDTWAALLYKTGDKKNALKVARSAIKIAQKEHVDYLTATLLIKEIEKAHKK